MARQARILINRGIMTQPMRVTVADVEDAARNAGLLAELGRPLDESDCVGDAFKHASIYAQSCLGWIWRQWLLANSATTIRSQVEPLVERGLQIRDRCRSVYQRYRHDLFLLHCAIFASPEEQLRRVVEAVSHSSGEGDHSPADDGELYAAAWCGLMKYWILGHDARAATECDVIWRAYRDPQVLAAPKPLTAAWTKRNWRVFVERQTKDFEKMWNQARKDAWTVCSETSTEIVVRTDGCRIGYRWCWAHCAMALLAYRQGVEVETDPLWFPPHALKCVDRAK